MPHLVINQAIMQSSTSTKNKGSYSFAFGIII